MDAAVIYEILFNHAVVNNQKSAYHGRFDKLSDRLSHQFGDQRDWRLFGVASTGSATGKGDSNMVRGASADSTSGQ